MFWFYKAVSIVIFNNQFIAIILAACDQTSLEPLRPEAGGARINPAVGLIAASTSKLGQTMTTVDESLRETNNDS